MLPVLRMAYPHPLASTCCCQVGPAGPRPPPGPPAPNAGAPGAAPGAARPAGGVTTPAPGTGAPGAPPAPAGSGPRAPPRPGPKPPKPNSMMTGTAPVAPAGVVNANPISTVICGYAELSTWPTSCLTITGTSPTVSLLVLVTSHVTLGTTLGTRP